MFWTHWINENPQILICNLPLLKPFKGCATATKNSPILIQTNLYWYKPSIYPPGVLGPLIFPIKNLLANFPLPTPFFFSLRQYADVLGNTVFSLESPFLKKFFIGKGWLKGTAHMVAPSNWLLAPSVILSDLIGSTCLLVIGAFQSTVFVPVFQGSCDSCL